MLQFLKELPQIYPAIGIFLVLFFAYLWAAISGVDASIVGKVGSMVDALFWALIGGFALGQRSDKPTIQAQHATVHAPVEGPVTIKEDRT